MSRRIVHRSETGLEYQGLQMHVPPGVHEGVIELLTEHLQTSARILDLGAGSGAFTRRLHDAGYAVHAADMDLQGWSVVDVRVTQVDFNREVWDLPEAGFEAIAAIEVIEHLENPSQFFRNVAKHLVSGGILIFTTPNIVSLQSRRRMLLSGEFAFFGHGLLFEAGHRTPLPFWLLEDLLASEGFEILQRRFLGHQGLVLRPGRSVWKALAVPCIDLLLSLIGRQIPADANLKTTIAYVARGPR
jgi:SAM-dependent methyltransferase